MFDVEFYSRNNKSDIYEFVKEVIQKKDSDSKRMIYFLTTLEEHGPNISIIINNSVKQIEGKLFEIRPGNNRVFYFTHINDKIFLLHGFRKQSNKTPKKEIDKAIRRMNEIIKGV